MASRKTAKKRCKLQRSAPNAKPKKTIEHCRLLDLPPELRLIIYEYLFASLASNAKEREIANTTALFTLNGQVVREAGPVFFKHFDELAKTFSRIEKEYI
jgi:hypothetical protein